MGRMGSVSDLQAFAERLRRRQSELQQEMEHIGDVLHMTLERIDSGDADAPDGITSFARSTTAEHPQSGSVGTPMPSYPGGRQLGQNRNQGVSQRREPASVSARNGPWASQYRYVPAHVSQAPSQGERYTPATRRVQRRTATPDGYDSVMTFMGRQGGIALNEMRNEMTSDSEDDPLIDLSDEPRGRDPALDYLDSLRNPPPMRSPRSSAYWEVTRGGHLGPSLRTLSPSPAAYPRTSSVAGTGIAPESWMFGPRIRGSTAGHPSLSNIGTGAFRAVRRRVGDYMVRHFDGDPSCF